MDCENSGSDILKLICNFKYREINELLNILISTDSKERRIEIFEEILEFLQSKNIDTTELKSKINQL